MNRLVVTPAMLALGLLITSCKPPNARPIDSELGVKLVSGLKVGDSDLTVKSRLGEPNKLYLRSGSTAWSYQNRLRQEEFGNETDLMLFFRDGKLTGGFGSVNGEYLILTKAKK